MVDHVVDASQLRWREWMGRVEAVIVASNHGFFDAVSRAENISSPCWIGTKSSRHARS
jgi:hypothetical protein